MPVPEGIQLLGPVYWIAGGMLAGVSFRYGGIEALTIVLAILVALWAFADSHNALELCTLFMVYLFVFFQREAPLGEELPEEFFFWGAGVALITAGLCGAALLSSGTSWPLVRKRMTSWPSLAMWAMLIMIVGAAANGLFLGNQPFAVVRQLFGCLLLPTYYFIALVILRSSDQVARWLVRSSWAVALGAAWYVLKLLSASMARGVYYREQSPLTGYAGVIGVVAFAGILEQRNLWRKATAFVQASICSTAIVLMGNRAALASLTIAAGLLVIVCVRRRGWLATTLATIVVASAIAGAFYYGNRFLDNRGIGGDIARRFIIKVSDDRSFQGRMAQMDAVMDVIRKRPVLGAGMGSETVFVAPEEGRLRLTSVDNGWGYVMLKTGLLGLAIFVAFLALILRESLRNLLRSTPGTLRSNSLALLGLLLFGLVVFWSGPSLLHFTSAGFFGTALAATSVLAESRHAAAAGGAEWPR
ncbi:MAG TPA: O-antigen ligase family protein [Candidatus Limnocylindrales bacterium]|nr:O-antigen ligase family protein [Candidatus Limnocylindrales bacterium]